MIHVWISFNTNATILQTLRNYFHVGIFSHYIKSMLLKIWSKICYAMLTKKRFSSHFCCKLRLELLFPVENQHHVIVMKLFLGTNWLLKEILKPWRDGLKISSIDFWNKMRYMWNVTEEDHKIWTYVRFDGCWTTKIGPSVIPVPSDHFHSPSW